MDCDIIFSYASNRKSDNLFSGSEQDLANWTKQQNLRIMLYDNDYSLTIEIALLHYF